MADRDSTSWLETPLDKYSSSSRSLPTSLGGGDSPLPTEAVEADEIDGLLRQRAAILSGGRDRRGGAVLTFPQQTEGQVALSREQLKYLLAYMIRIPSLEVQELGFTVIIDMRGPSSTLSHARQVLQALQRYLRGLVYSVYIIRPTQFWQKHTANVSLRREARDIEFEVVNLSSPDKLIKFVERNSLTRDLGGFLPYDHEEWIRMRQRVERFLNNAFEIISRLDELFELMSSSRVAADLSAAETMLHRHQTQHDEITETPVGVLSQGENLLRWLEGAPYNRQISRAGDPPTAVVTQDTIMAMARVRSQLEALRSKQRSLESLWIERQARLQQNVQLLRLQALPLDLTEMVTGLCEQWLYGPQSIGKNGSEAEQLRQKHEQFAVSSMHVRSDFDEVRRRADTLVVAGHYATEEITDWVEDLEGVVTAFISQVERRGRLLSLAVDFHCSVVQVEGSMAAMELRCESECEDLPDDIEEAQKRIDDWQKQNDEAARHVQGLTKNGQLVLDLIEEIEVAPPVVAIRDKYPPRINYSAATSDVQLTLQRLSSRRQEVDQMASKHRRVLEQCHQVVTNERDVRKVIGWLHELYIALLTHHENIGESTAVVREIQSAHSDFMTKAEKSHSYGQQLLETATSLRQELALEMVTANQLSRHLETQWKLTSAGMLEKSHRLGVALLFHRNADELMAKLTELRDEIAQELPTGRNVSAVELQLNRGRKQVQATFSAHQDTRKAGRTLVTQMSQQLSQHRQLAAKTQLISDKVDFAAVEVDIATAAKSLKMIIEQLETLKAEAEDAWQKQENRLQQCILLRQYEESVESVLSWLTNEAVVFLATHTEVGVRLEAVVRLLQEHTSFEQAAGVRAGTVKQLQDQVSSLAAANPLYREEFRRLKDTLMRRWGDFERRLRQRVDLMSSAASFYANTGKFLEELDSAAASYQSVEMADEVAGMQQLLDKHNRLQSKLDQLMDSAIKEEARHLRNRLSDAIVVAQEDGGMAAEQRLWIAMDGATVRLLQHATSCHAELTERSNARRSMLHQVLDLRQFESRVHEIISWLDSHEAEYLPLDAALCEVHSSVKELRSKHEAAEKESQSLVENAAQLLTTARDMCESGHYASTQLTSMRAHVQQRVVSFSQQMERRGQVLDALGAFHEAADVCTERHAAVEKKLCQVELGRDWASTQQQLATLEALQKELSSISNPLLGDTSRLLGEVELVIGKTMREIATPRRKSVEAVRSSLSQSPLGMTLESVPQALVKVMESLSKKQQSLLNLWEARNNTLQQCLVLNKFRSDVQQVIDWLEQVASSFFRTHLAMGQTLDEVQPVVTAHQEFRHSTQPLRVKLESLHQTATAQARAGHYSAETFLTDSERVQELWDRFVQGLEQRQQLLLLHANVHTSAREVDEHLKGLSAYLRQQSSRQTGGTFDQLLSVHSQRAKPVTDAFDRLQEELSRFEESIERSKAPAGQRRRSTDDNLVLPTLDTETALHGNRDLLESLKDRITTAMASWKEQKDAIERRSVLAQFDSRSSAVLDWIERRGKSFLRQNTRLGDMLMEASDERAKFAGFAAEAEYECGSVEQLLQAGKEVAAERPHDKERVEQQTEQLRIAYNDFHSWMDERRHLLEKNYSFYSNWESVMQRLQRLRDSLHTAPMPSQRRDVEHALTELAQHGTALDSAIKPLIAQGRVVIEMAEKQNSQLQDPAKPRAAKGVRSIQLAIEKVEQQKEAVEKAAAQRHKRLEMVLEVADLIEDGRLLQEDIAAYAKDFSLEQIGCGRDTEEAQELMQRLVRREQEEATLMSRVNDFNSVSQELPEDLRAHTAREVRHLRVTVANLWQGVMTARVTRQRTVEKCVTFHTLVEQARDWCNEGGQCISRLEQQKERCELTDDAQMLLDNLNSYFLRSQGEQKVRLEALLKLTDDLRDDQVRIIFDQLIAETKMIMDAYEALHNSLSNFMQEIDDDSYSEESSSDEYDESLNAFMVTEEEMESERGHRIPHQDTRFLSVSSASERLDSASDMEDEEVDTLTDFRETKKAKEANQKMKYAVKELVNTERTYVKDLSVLVEGFMPHMKDANLPTILVGAEKDIFANAPDILAFHRKLLSDLEKFADENPSEACLSFVRYEKEFWMYFAYCKNKRKSDERLAQFGGTFFEEIKVGLGLQLSLGAYLLTPVQRIQRYKMLLENILKYATRAKMDIIVDLEKALAVVSRIPQLADIAVDYSLVEGVPENIRSLDERMFLLANDFLVWGGKSRGRKVAKGREMHVFLHEKMVIFAKKKEGTSSKDHGFTFKYILKTFEMGMAVEPPLDKNDKNVKFKFVLPIGQGTSAHQQFTLQAQSMDTKAEWLKAISNLLERQFTQIRNQRKKDMEIAKQQQLLKGEKDEAGEPVKEDKPLGPMARISQLFAIDRQRPNRRSSERAAQLVGKMNKSLPEDLYIVSGDYTPPSGSTSHLKVLVGQRVAVLDRNTGTDLWLVRRLQSETVQAEEGLLPRKYLRKSTAMSAASTVSERASERQKEHDYAEISELPMSPMSSLVSDTRLSQGKSHSLSTVSEDSVVKSQTSGLTSAAPPPFPVRIPRPSEPHYALESFVGEGNACLSVRRGQEVAILDVTPADFYLVRVTSHGRSEEGLLPKRIVGTYAQLAEILASEQGSVSGAPSLTGMRVSRSTSLTSPPPAPPTPPSLPPPNWLPLSPVATALDQSALTGAMSQLKSPTLAKPSPTTPLSPMDDMHMELQKKLERHRERKDVSKKGVSLDDDAVEMLIARECPPSEGFNDRSGRPNSQQTISFSTAKDNQPRSRSPRSPPNISADTVAEGADPPPLPDRLRPKSELAKGMAHPPLPPRPASLGARRREGSATKTHFSPVSSPENQLKDAQRSFSREDERLFVAIDDYESKRPGFVSVRKGQTMTVIDTVDNELSLVMVHTTADRAQEEGLIYTKYIQCRAKPTVESPEPEQISVTVSRLLRRPASLPGDRAASPRLPKTLSMPMVSALEEDKPKAQLRTRLHDRIRRDLYKSAFLGDRASVDLTEDDLAALATPGQAYIAFHAWQAEEKGQISLFAGQRLCVIDSSHETWWLARVSVDDSGKFVEGWVPANHLERLGEDAEESPAHGSASSKESWYDPASNRDQQGDTYVAIYPYQAEGEGTITVAKGDRLEVLQTTEEWWYGRVLSNKAPDGSRIEGWVPAIYLQRKEQPSDLTDAPQLEEPCTDIQNSSEDEEEEDDHLLPPLREDSRRTSVFQDSTTTRHIINKHSQTLEKEMRARDALSVTPPISDPEQEKKSVMTKRHFLINELIDTERSYIDKLKFALENHLTKLNGDDVPSFLTGKKLLLFANMEEIYLFHKNEFLPELEACGDDAEKVGRCFVNHEDSLQMYVSYCRNKPKCDVFLSDNVKQFFADVPSPNKLTIEHYLMAPVQRISKYQLMLKDLAKQTARANLECLDLDSAVEVMLEIPRRADNAITLDLVDQSHEIESSHGDLLLQDAFIITDRGKKKSAGSGERLVFLFQDLLLLTKKRRSDPLPGEMARYAIKHKIKASDLSLTAEVENDPRRFLITVGKSGSAQEKIVFQAKNVNIKMVWMNSIQGLLTDQLMRLKEQRNTNGSTALGQGSSSNLSVGPTSRGFSLFDHSTAFERGAMRSSGRSQDGRLRSGKKDRVLDSPVSIVQLEAFEVGDVVVITSDIIAEGSDDVHFYANEKVRVLQIDVPTTMCMVEALPLTPEDNPDSPAAKRYSLLSNRTAIGWVKQQFIRLQRPGETEGAVAPKIVHGPSQSIVLRGSTVPFNCVVSGYPTPSVRWTCTRSGTSGDSLLPKTNSTKSFLLESSENVKVHSAPGASSLEISNVQCVDTGLYTCTAVNRAGTDSRSVRLVVQDVPSPPPYLAIKKVTTNSISVMWKPPDFNGNSPVIAYEIQLIEVGKTQWLTVLRDVIDTFCTLRELTAGRLYQVRVVAVNVVGRSKPSETSEQVRTHARSSGVFSSSQSKEVSRGHRVSPRSEPVDEFYLIGEDLGKGRFSVVRRCTELSTKRVYAAKHIRMRGQSRDEVQREAELMQGLRHPHVVFLHDWFETKRSVVLVIELVTGSELLTWLVEQENGYTEMVATLCIKQLVSGLSYLHSNSVMHLDIQPRNVLTTLPGAGSSMTPPGVKIIDFGSARKIEGKKEVRLWARTAHEFAAPEVINYDSVTPAADMWSVGVLVYLVLSGVSPFFHADYQDISSAVQRGTVDISPDQFAGVSTDGRNFIQQLLNKSPKHRLTADQCLSHPWIRHGTAGKLPAQLRVQMRLRDYISESTEQTTSLLQMSALTRSDLSLASLGSMQDTPYEVAPPRSVAHTPVISNGPEDTVVTEGGTVRFQCSVSGLPEPLVKWQKDNQAPLVSGGGLRRGPQKIAIHMQGELCLLQITHVTEADTGTYTITATNPAGVAVARAELRIANPSGEPQYPSVSEVDKNCVLVTWETVSADNNQPVLAYIIERCRADQEIWDRAAYIRCAGRRSSSSSGSENLMSHVCEDLLPDMSYQFRVRPLFADGQGKASCLSPVILISQPESSEPPFRILRESAEKYFLFMSEIGHGRFSTVYRVKEKSTDREFAAKRILSDSALARRSSEVEIETLQRLSYPRVCALQAAYDSQGCLVEIMELMRGGTLLAHITALDVFDEDVAAFFVRQILEGLHYLHSRRIVHNNLHPANVTVVGGGVPDIKLIDFTAALDVRSGPAVLTQRQLQRQHALEFCSPEVVCRQAVGPATDLWSLGALTYVLVSGTLPFHGSSPEDVCHRIAEGYFHFDELRFQSVLPEVRDLIARLLTEKDNLRPAAHQCLKHQWLRPTLAQSAHRKASRLDVTALRHFNSTYYARPPPTTANHVDDESR